MPILSINLPSDVDFTASDAILEAGPRIRIDIAKAIGPDAGIPPFKQSDRVPALIDSGADMSMIRLDFAHRLALPVVDTSMSYGIHGPRTDPDPVYLLRYRVEELEEVRLARFVGVDLVPETPVILGREFLANKIMVYDGVVGRVTLAV